MKRMGSTMQKKICLSRKSFNSGRVAAGFDTSLSLLQLVLYSTPLSKDEGGSGIESPQELPRKNNV